MNDDEDDRTIILTDLDKKILEKNILGELYGIESDDDITIDVPKIDR